MSPRKQIKEQNLEDSDSKDLLDKYTSNGLKIMLLAAILPNEPKKDNFRTPRSSMKR